MRRQFASIGWWVALFANLGTRSRSVAGGDAARARAVGRRAATALPLDPRVKRFLDALAAGNPPSARTVSVPQRRAQLVELMKLGGAEVSVGLVEDGTIPGSRRSDLHPVYSPELKEPRRSFPRRSCRA